MAKKPDSQKSNAPAKGALSKDDRALWHHVSRDMPKLQSNRFTGFEDLVKDGRMPVVHTPAVKKSDLKKTTALLKPATTPKPLSRGQENQVFLENVTPSVRQTVPGIDRNTSEKLRKGRMVIEGRVDLHGMNRREAHSRLKSFLGSAHRQGKRCVLVITGKGSSAHQTDDAPFMGGGRKGILKEEVPKWLSEPDMRRLVLDYRSAQVKHGGAGALYVLLRRMR